ncbi:hypothetical protein FQN57_005920 [Myotisia sp. PD_48]|nr:hypothetical protein FQN57_005920 [Myotisia sp. PD_48]
MDVHDLVNDLSADLASFNLDDFDNSLRNGPESIPAPLLRLLPQGPLKNLVVDSKNNEAAACNAVTAFLEAALASNNSELCTFARSESTWLSVYDIFLDRYEYCQPKPMKQVLTTLVNILAAHPDPDIYRSICAHVTTSAIRNIVLVEPRSRLKASIVSFQYLIRKDAFATIDLINQVRLWLSAEYEAWMPIVGDHCIKMGLPISILAPGSKGVPEQDAESHVLTAQILCLSLLLHLHNSNVATISGQVFVSLVIRLKSVSEKGEFKDASKDSDPPFWTTPLKYMCLLYLENLDAMINHVLHPLFQGRASEFQSFVHVLPIEALTSGNKLDTSSPDLDLLIAVLQTGKALGLVYEDQGPENATDKKLLGLETEKLQPFLIHLNTNTRISAISLFISASSTAKALSPAAFIALSQMLPFIHSDTNAYSRGKLLSLIRKLIIRLRGAPFTESSATSKTTPTDAKSFLVWYLEFLEHELRPSASYQTHILALNVLEMIVQTGLDPSIDSTNLSRLGSDQRSWPFQLQIFQPNLLRALGDLLIDPYDEVRKTALTILVFFPSTFFKPKLENEQASDYSNPYIQLLSAVPLVIKTAGRNRRADSADGLARLYYLLFILAESGEAPRGENPNCYKYSIVNSLLDKLEECAAFSDPAPEAASRCIPIHGYLASLRYIMEVPNFHALMSLPGSSLPYWKLQLYRTISICEAMWDAVKDVLCVDSPEREYRNTTGKKLGPKDVLSCSWRVLRESSLLLNSILLNTTWPTQGPHQFGYYDLKRVGILTFAQLAALRHRGAFTAVSQTFASCCQRCSQSTNSAAVELPAAWFSQILTTIHEQSSRLTRRSAGIPALAVGVASSAKPELFHDIMETLQMIAGSSYSAAPERSEMKLPQIHALNCLKDIFSATNLAIHTEKYVMAALGIAADCLGSEIWDIRNCGLMLFRALVNRMCRPVAALGYGSDGNSESEPKHLIPFRKFPGLISLLSRLLESESTTAVPSGDASAITERVFPALELLGSKAPSASSNEDQQILALVRRQFESPVWGIRDHAARTLANLIDKENILSAAEDASHIRETPSRQNLVHGNVLCIRHLLSRLWALPKSQYKVRLPSIISTMTTVFDNLRTHVISPFILWSIMEVLNDALRTGIQYDSQDEILKFYDVVSGMYDFDWIYTSSTSISKAGPTLPRSSALLLEIIILGFLVTRLLRKSSPEELAQLLETCSKVDSDVVPAALRRLHSEYKDQPSSQNDRIELYYHVIKNIPSKQVKEAAISNLASELEKILDSDAKSLEKLGFLLTLRPVLDGMEKGPNELSGRGMVNASHRLQACLLSLDMVSCPETPLSGSLAKGRLDDLVNHMSFSIHEQTAYETRHAAIVAMTSLTKGLEAAGVKFSEAPTLLHCYVILYDMLNDDDEELRRMAALAAAPVLVEQSSIPRLPAATAIDLTEFLTDHFTDLPGIFEYSLRRFLGVHRTTSLFSSNLVVFMEAANDLEELFAADKNNLYIDDVREVETWARVLCKLPYNDENAFLYEQMYPWVLDGLSTMVEATRAHPIDGVLGWTSSASVFVAGLRTLYGAKIILEREDRDEMDVDILTIEGNLHALLEDTVDSHAHRLWISIIKELLMLLNPRAVQ